MIKRTLCFVVFSLLCCTAYANGQHKYGGPARITTYGDENADIYTGVAVPSVNPLFFTSGTVADDGDDTYSQAMNAMQKISKLLMDAKLTMKDIFFLRVYLVPDPKHDNKIDMAGWNKAYKEFFNNDINPKRVARSVIGVNSLAASDKLIEIEAIAAYPVR